MKCEGKKVREHGLYCPEREKEQKSLNSNSSLK